jgi:hypothetical protein
VESSPCGALPAGNRVVTERGGSVSSPAPSCGRSQHESFVKMAAGGALGEKSGLIRKMTGTPSAVRMARLWSALTSSPASLVLLCEPLRQDT